MSRSVGRGCDDYREAPRDCDPPIETQKLCGDLPLVVEHGHHAGKLTFTGSNKDGIRRKRPLDIHPLLPGSFHRRPDDRFFFRAKKTFLPAMGVYCRYSDLRVFYSGTAHRLMQKSDGPQDPVRSEM